MAQLTHVGRGARLNALRGTTLVLEDHQSWLRGRSVSAPK